MNKPPIDPHETVVEDGSLTVPPGPTSATVVTAEMQTVEPEPSLDATAFGVELADGVQGESRRAFLVIHEGHEGRVIELRDGDEVSFGRSSSTTVVVDDPRVSRHHARLLRRGATLMVEDLASRNGTKVNGASVRNARRIVVSGDVVRVGSAEIIVAAAIRGDEDDESSIGVSVADAKMRDVFALAKQLAGGDTSVLIQGETGVGKNVVAQQIHRWSARASGPFVRIDCANLPDMLLEGALFGYAGGGNVEASVGQLEAASGGTLLLDGVGELSANAQAKLMKAIETRRILRIGGKEETPIDVRVLAATHRDLPSEVGAKRFREDLYYAISNFTLRVPPLRERHAEIDLFAHLFAMRFAVKVGQPAPFFVEDAATQLLRYEWPSNVRELRDAVWHAVSVSPGGRMELESLPEVVRRAHRPSVRTRA